MIYLKISKELRAKLDAEVNREKKSKQQKKGEAAIRDTRAKVQQIVRVKPMVLETFEEKIK